MRPAALVMLLVMLVPAWASAQQARVRIHNIERPGGSESDVRAEIDIGREIAARIIGRYSLLRDERRIRYVNLVGKSLALYANRPEIEFTFGILDTEIINAYAAPGGYIFITRGALDAMKSEAELAGVIAHEIIHVTEKHIVKELNIHGSDDSPVAGLARLVGGVTDASRMAFVKAVDEAVKILFERGYKRDDEAQSDTLGAVLMATGGYDPAALVSYFERIKAKEGKEISSFDALHAPVNDRVVQVRQTIAAEGLEGGKYMSGKERFDEHTTGKK